VNSPIKLRNIVTIISLALLPLLAACGPAASGQGTDVAGRKVRVVATTSMIADLAKVVGGDRVEVQGLMGAGVDPHLYKASAGDVTKLENADIILYNGLHLEAAMGEVLERMGSRKKTVAVTGTIPKEKLDAPPNFQGNYDPHVWFDVTLWKYAVEKTRDAYTELDPGSADAYKANAEKYLAELDTLHEYVRTEAAKVPEAQRALVTAHDAFHYFGRAYDFEVRGLQGISTVSEAGPADIQSLADFIAERKIPAIFVESSVPRRNIEALQAAVKSRGFDVQIGGQLFSDALGNPGTPEGTYTGMVRYNIDTIVAALSQ
jgi:manganese/zinc/iron transport system substrate-binding protein